MLKSIHYLAIFFVVSCASSPKHTFQDYSETASTFLGEEFDVQYVRSDGAIADTTFISMSKGSGASNQSILLAQRLNSTIDKPYKVAIIGENYSKNAVVVESALNEMPERSGTSSTLVCFCSGKYRSSIRDAAQRVGVNIHYVVD